MRGGRNTFSVVVDGQEVGVLNTSKHPHDYLLYSSRSNPFATEGHEDEGDAGSQKPHVKNSVTTFELRKRTESRSIFNYITNKATSVVTVFDVSVTEGATLEKFADNNSQRAIEFVGDSDFTGFGNLGEKTGLGFTSAFSASANLQDVTQAVPSFVAKAFGAEYCVTGMYYIVYTCFSSFLMFFRQLELTGKKIAKRNKPKATRMDKTNLQRGVALGLPSTSPCPTARTTLPSLKFTIGIWLRIPPQRANLLDQVKERF